MNDGARDQGMDQCNITSIADFASGMVEGPERKNKALDCSVVLGANPHLWSEIAGSGQKNSQGQNELTLGCLSSPLKIRKAVIRCTIHLMCLFLMWRVRVLLNASLEYKIKKEWSEREDFFLAIKKKEYSILYVKKNTPMPCLPPIEKWIKI